MISTFMSSKVFRTNFLVTDLTYDMFHFTRKSFMSFACAFKHPLLTNFRTGVQRWHQY